jgi:hypothetical protein
LDMFCLNYFFRVSISSGDPVHLVVCTHLLIFLLSLYDIKCTFGRLLNDGMLWQNK